MTLVGAVTNITKKKVTEDQAKQFALDNYGVLAAYIKSQVISELLESKRNIVREKTLIKAKRKAKEKGLLK